MFVSGLLQGQSLPTAVDNSVWFPPVRSQQNITNCSNFALVYYLKSYIWNREFDRDPNLEENQFSHNAVWNQSITNEHRGDESLAFDLMRAQGCPTVADFRIDETEQETIPDFETREKGLKYHSEALYQIRTIIWNRGMDSSFVRQNILRLKDSLSHGRCFTISIPIFNSMFEMTDERNVWDFFPGTTKDSAFAHHIITITGYDDNIKTIQGKGAFRVINSNKELASGKWWMDYNWLFLEDYSYVCSFLKEDFSRQPELSLNLDLSGMMVREVSGYDFWKFSFVDQIFYVGKWVDYDEDSWRAYPRFVQIQKVNGHTPEEGLKYLPETNKTVFIPLHNHDGHRQLVNDLTDFVSAADFKSLEILVQDPVSAEYVGQSGKVLYSYEREANSHLNEGYVKFLGTDKLIYGKVVNLSDTTVICKDFYSYPIGVQMSPYQGDAYISKCTSVIRRFLITFDIADITSGVEDLPLMDNNSGLTLEQNYPNPVANMTTINFSIAAHSSVSLKVYDLLGKEVETLVSCDLNPGEHQIKFDASRLSHGVYVYILRTRDGLESKRMIKE
jgi:hypothetical protein